MSDSCSRFVEIGRSASPEDVPELRLHLNECLYCQSQWAATKRLIEVSRQIPTRAPEAGWRQRTRNALVLATAESGRRRGSPVWVRAVVYASVVLCAAGVFAAVGTVGIPWWQRQRQAAPARDRDQGQRPPAQTALVVSPETSASDPGVPSAAAPAPRGPSTGKAAGRSAATAKTRGALASLSLPASPPVATHEPSPAELAFSEGWQALRTLDYPRAVVAMRRALQLAPNSALAADAHYWEAVALARQGLATQARDVMEDFLRRFPRSPRAGEVSAMLGWSYVESHEWATAERLFRAAEGDRASAVRESARKGLQTTARQR